MQLAGRLAIESRAPDRRRKARHAVEDGGQLNICGFHGMDVTVSDLSESGFRARTGQYIPPGSYVRLKMVGLGIAIGTVAWSRNGEVGGEFLNPVSETRLRSIVGYRPVSRVA